MKIYIVTEKWFDPLLSRPQTGFKKVFASRQAAINFQRNEPPSGFHDFCKTTNQKWVMETHEVTP